MINTLYRDSTGGTLLLIIAITGMPGAGKSTAAKAMAATGLQKIAMGDMIREETKRRNLYPDDKNMGTVMRELRDTYGAGAVAELSLRSIHAMKTEVVVVDGIRSMAEVVLFRQDAEVKLLAILASPGRRFELMQARGRTDDPHNIESFNTRDERELSIGIGNAIALANAVVSNERGSIDELGAATMSIVKEWMKPVEQGIS
jgi:dephospho-CoA kinase